MPLQAQHHAAQQRPDDGADPPDAERPADSGRADEGRIERRRQRIGSDLGSHHAEARSKHRRDDELDCRAGLSDRPEEQGGGEIRTRQHPIGTEALDQNREHQRADDAADLEQCGCDYREPHRDSGVVDDGGQPGRTEIDHQQVGEEHHPDQDGGQRAPLGEKVLHRKSLRVLLRSDEPGAGREPQRRVDGSEQLGHVVVPGDSEREQPDRLRKPEDQDRRE